MEPLAMAKNVSIKMEVPSHLPDVKMDEAAELAGKYRVEFYNLLKKYDLKGNDFKDHDKEK